jgi:penicillin-binding protein 1A
MEGATNFGTAHRLQFKYNVYAQTAAKTGTTQHHSDGWFMAVTPKLTSGVWVGAEDRSVHFDRMSMGQGASMALPIYAYFIKKVYADKTLGISDKDVFEAPPDMPPIPSCMEYANQMESEGDYTEDEW